VAALEGETAAAAAEYIECTAELDGHVTLLVLNKKRWVRFLVSLKSTRQARAEEGERGGHPLGGLSYSKLLFTPNPIYFQSLYSKYAPP